MITPEQYFGGKPHTPKQEIAARDLLARVNTLLNEAEADGMVTHTHDPDTGTEISGSKGGAGDGGFRLSRATTGRLLSSHKEARGVDVYDPSNDIDGWLDDSLLIKYNLYREAPESTPGWCHLTTRAPHSGRRTFQP